MTKHVSPLRLSIDRRYQRLDELEGNAAAQKIEMELCKRSVFHFFDWWVWTYDPRSALTGLPHVPFDLFPKQREFIQWLLDREREQNDGACEKSRDQGFTWMCGGYAVWRWLFYPGYKSTFGSRKSELVDKLGDPDSIFEKIRTLILNLPSWMTPKGYEFKEMLITNHLNGNTIRGEAGDEMGRGGRSTTYFLDEYAFQARPDTVERATSRNASVRIFGSSANGTGNTFYRKIHGGLAKRQTFRLHYSDDPRFTQERITREKADLEPHIWAAEMEINYAASVEGVVIPSAWVEASIGALQKLGLANSGLRRVGFDVADEGLDLNAACGMHGVEVIELDQWSGKNDDIYGSVERVFSICDTEEGFSLIRYDSDGLGAGVRGDARKINEERRKKGITPITVEAFRGSEGVIQPELQDVKGRKNIDYFLNRKAQEWWRLRRRFQITFRWVVEGIVADPTHIISINPDIKFLTKLTSELSQPTFTVNSQGKLGIDKTPEGTRSPNCADALMIANATPSVMSLGVTRSVLKKAAMSAAVNAARKRFR